MNQVRCVGQAFRGSGSLFSSQITVSLTLSFSVSRTADGITEDSCSERRRRRRVRQRKALSSDANNTATSLGSAQLSSALPVRQELRGVPRRHEPSLLCDSILCSLFGFFSYFDTNANDDFILPANATNATVAFFTCQKSDHPNRTASCNSCLPFKGYAMCFWQRVTHT